MTPGLSTAASEVPGLAASGRPRSSRLVTLLASVLLVLIVLGLYWPTLRYEFVGWDDDRNVTMNPMVTTPRGLLSIWTTLRGPPGFPHYPLFYTSFWLEHLLWDTKPSGFHATNVALHALNAVLVLLVLRRLGQSLSVAWAVALLFAVHPMQVESVAWITERKNVLSGAFYLLAFLCYVRHRQTGTYLPGQTAPPVDLRSFKPQRRTEM